MTERLESIEEQFRRLSYHPDNTPIANQTGYEDLIRMPVLDFYDMIDDMQKRKKS